eukprot:EC721056.1.p1 GENE.EC721056.1~~EC721056.1.p1  ORF type:complete len:167 (+),score=11.89 EC721056.1:57-557(+)
MSFLRRIIPALTGVARQQAQRPAAQVNQVLVRNAATQPSSTYIRATPRKTFLQRHPTLEKIWNKWQVQPVDYPRWSRQWWWETAVKWTVFAITGSTSAFVARPFVAKFVGLEGSLKDGPWTYRIASIVALTPIYSVMLMGVGTAFRRGPFFIAFAKNMWTRMIPRV